MNDLTRRVEEASMNAWPANHQLLLDGWLIRLSNGFTKRANCVVPLYHSTEHKPEKALTSEPHSKSADLTLDKIRYCENLFAREQLQTVFRLTTHRRSAELDDQLALRGYNRVDETQVQLLDLLKAPEVLGGLEAPAPGPQMRPKMRIAPIPHWLRIYAKFAEMPDTASELHSSLIRSIRPDCAFALLEIDDEPVACALGVLEHDLLGVFDVITAREQRGKGYADLLLRHLLLWGKTEGAQHAYLQVIADNAAALRLYKRLGFRRLYSYWYRLTS